MSDGVQAWNEGTTVTPMAMYDCRVAPEDRGRRFVHTPGLKGRRWSSVQSEDRTSACPRRGSDSEQDRCSSRASHGHGHDQVQ
jgi:hypothetical protein